MSGAITRPGDCDKNHTFAPHSKHAEDSSRGGDSEDLHGGSHPAGRSSGKQGSDTQDGDVQLVIRVVSLVTNLGLVTAHSRWGQSPQCEQVALKIPRPKIIVSRQRAFTFSVDKSDGNIAVQYFMLGGS